MVNGQRMRGFEARDLLSFRVVGDIDLSLDGKWLVYTVQEIDESRDQYFSNHWLIPIEGGAPRQLTFGRDLNQSPRFSSDGSRLAFLSNRGGGPAQLYVLALAGGAAADNGQRLTQLEHGAGAPAWSADGQRIAFAAQVASDDAPNAPRLIRKLPYKSDGTGLLSSRTSQIFVVSAEGGDARQLTHGEGSATEPNWSPDGRQLVFSRRRSGPRDSHRSDLFRIGSAGGPVTQLTSRCPECLAPAWSPDGRLIAFYGTAREGDPSLQVWFAEPEPDRERPVADPAGEIANFPLGRTRPPAWSADGAEVAVVMVSASTSQLAMISPQGEVRQILHGDRQITMLAASAKEHRVCYLWSDPRLCGLLSTATWSGKDDRLLLNVNEDWAHGRRWPRASLRQFSSPGGSTTHGVLMLPEGQGPWPVLVDVHGGPHAYVEFGFPYHPYWYELASRGWAVLSLNPVGSASYGQEFADRLRGRWGELDLPEHLAAIEGLVAEGIADGARVAISGKSYGGYMAAWAIGKTRRFRAAVCSASVTNLESHFGTSDTGYYVDPYYIGGELSDIRERYHRLSPIHCASAAETPTLILHGEEDQRCPIGQAEELFAALMHAKKAEVEFVRYPGGTHHLAETGRPSHRVDYHGRIAEFVSRHAASSR
jgi:dipeptidyl aminopeptidase/acylaminoacyl peptidase